METATTSQGRKLFIAEADQNVIILENLPDHPRRDIWLTSVPYPDPSFVGDGTQSFPKYVEDGFIDSALLSTDDPVTFRLTSGIFFTRGTWAFARRRYATLATGQRLIGSGSALTFIRLKDSVLQTDGNDRKDTNLFWCGAMQNTGLCGCHVEGVTLEGMLLGKPDDLLVGGLYAWGYDFTARDVVVTGLRGSYEKKHEVFGIGCDSAGWVTLDRCRVEDVEPASYVSGISVGCSQYGNRVRPNTVRDCSVDLGSGNWFALSAARETWVRGFCGIGSKYGFYNDTDILFGVYVSDSVFRAEATAISLVVTNPGWPKVEIRFTNCQFGLLPGVGDLIGLELHDKANGPGTRFHDIILRDCEFDASPQQFYLATTNANELSNVSLLRTRAPRARLNQKSVKKGRFLLSGTESAEGNAVVTQLI